VSGIQWVRTGAVVKAFLSASKVEWHSSREMPVGTLVGKTHEWDCDFGISINETTVEIGKAEEGLNVLDISWYWPILDNLDFVWGHGEAFGVTAYIRGIHRK